MVDQLTTLTLTYPQQASDKILYSLLNTPVALLSNCNFVVAEVGSSSTAVKTGTKAVTLCFKNPKVNKTMQFSISSYL